MINSQGKARSFGSYWNNIKSVCSRLCYFHKQFIFIFYRSFLIILKFLIPHSLQALAQAECSLSWPFDIFIGRRKARAEAVDLQTWAKSNQVQKRNIWENDGFSEFGFNYSLGRIGAALQCNYSRGGVCTWAKSQIEKIVRACREGRLREVRRVEWALDVPSYTERWRNTVLLASAECTFVRGPSTHAQVNDGPCTYK